MQFFVLYCQYSKLILYQTFSLSLSLSLVVYIKLSKFKLFFGNIDCIQSNLLLICGDSLSQKIFCFICFAGFPQYIVLHGIIFPDNTELHPSIEPDDIEEFFKIIQSVPIHT